VYFTIIFPQYILQNSATAATSHNGVKNGISSFFSSLSLSLSIYLHLSFNSLTRELVALDKLDPTP